MKTVLFAYSRKGMETALRLAKAMDWQESLFYAPERLAEEPFLAEDPKAYERAFQQADAIAIVGACGIAVRKIAPYLKSKALDPAVLSLDELARFVIPLLSGHIGGANRLAEDAARALGAVPVVTTATDINHRFSVDEWAARRGFAIDSLKAAKAVSARILEAAVPLSSQLPLAGELPAGVIAKADGDLGIYIGWELRDPYEQTLRLVPRNLHLGIGCRKGIAKEAVKEAVEAVLKEYKLDKRAVKCAASIDLKAQEEGLLSYCREEAIPIAFYTAQELLQVNGSFTASDFVRSITGVDNVCERSALIGADQLIVKKTALNGVTVAVGAELQEVSFE